MSVKTAAEALETALKTVPGVRVHRDPSALTDPPAVVLGPPRLQWQGMCGGPTTAIFTVYVLVAMDERALERLWDLVPTVADVLDTVTGAVVTDANPGVFNAGGIDLPTYEITAEVSL